MRTKNSFKNMLLVMLSYSISILVGIVSQALFIKFLGSEYLGLNSLFTNIISMLAIAELGIGNAIIFHLYKPLANDNHEKIKSLMQFYKKSYHVIALVITFFGILIIPFIKYLVDIDSVTVNINIYIVYLLLLGDTILSYFFSYKRSILYADQKNYIIMIIHILYTLLLNTAQIIILYYTKNYYLYLIIKLVFRFLENLVISIVANIKYSYLNEKAKKVDEKTRKDIFKKVGALFFHKIGTFVVLGTDNIIIAKFLGLVKVGLYANYFLIINSIQMLFSQALSSITSSVGNLLVTEKKDKQFLVFKRLRFINFWIAVFSATGVFVVMESFITIWLGKSFILGKFVLITLVINLYQKLMRSTYSSFKEAAGIFYEDRFVPIVESVLNIVASIVLVKLIGLPGVFIGTIISGLALWCYSYPKYVYKKLFNRSYFNYFLETGGYILAFTIICLITYISANVYHFDNNYYEFIKNLICSLIIPNILIIVVYCKSSNFDYLLDLVNKKILRRNND